MKNKVVFLDPGEALGFKNMHDIIEYANRNHREKTAFRQFESKSVIKDISYGDFYDRTEALRAALYSCGYAGKHIAIFGETSHEWISAYIAVTSGVGVCVPIDRALPPETVALQLMSADVDTVFCSKRGLRIMEKALLLCDCVKTLVLMRTDKTDGINGCENVITQDALIEQGRRLLSEKSSAALPDKIIPDETCAIVYTSGTTGANKGVMLSNKSIMGTLIGCSRLLSYPDTATVSLLPINHTYELHAHVMSCLYFGIAICINDDLKHIVKNFALFAPEMTCMVPLMLDMIVRKLKKGIADSGREAKFNRAVKLSRLLRKIGIDKRRSFFSQILQPLGGNLKMIICGGAPVSQEVIDFFDDIGISVYNGYGITECSPVVAVNTFHAVKASSVGYVLPTVKVRIASPDENGSGEIQVCGDNVMKGYYKLPEDTARVFTEDGWFCTGDIGYLDEDNFLYINGRIKNLIILSNGKNIYPEEIEESILGHIAYIKECVVYANETNDGLCALFYPDTEYFGALGITSAADIKSHTRKDIDKMNALLPGFKQISTFDIVEKEFEKSTTHKIQRFKISAIK